MDISTEGLSARVLRVTRLPAPETAPVEAALAHAIIYQ